MYRYHGRAEVNPDNPHAFGVCDRCGFWYNLKDLVWQYDYEGGSTPINKRLLVCTRTCLDALNFQFALQILPPDPPPLYNVRPETFTLDEDSYLATQGTLGTNPVLTGHQIVTQANENITTAPLPDPFDGANCAYLASSPSYHGTYVGLAVAYLDLFLGNPASGGVSQLSAITGSATRTNIYASLAAFGTTSIINPSPIIVISASLAQVNVTYMALYDAATNGNLLLSGTASISGALPIVIGNPVAFDSVGISITLT